MPARRSPAIAGANGLVGQVGSVRVSASGHREAERGGTSKPAGHGGREVGCPGHKGLSWAVLKGAPLGSAVQGGRWTLTGSSWRGRGFSGSTSLRVPKACRRGPPGPKPRVALRPRSPGPPSPRLRTEVLSCESSLWILCCFGVTRLGSPFLPSGRKTAVGGGGPGAAPGQTLVTELEAPPEILTPDSASLAQASFLRVLLEERAWTCCP